MLHVNSKLNVLGLRLFKSRRPLGTLLRTLTNASEAAQVSFIGGGKMAEALIARIVDDYPLSVYDINQKRCSYLSEKYRIKAFPSIDHEAQTCVRNSDLVVLAVKPQNVKEIFKLYSSIIRKDALVLSVVAGLSLKEIESGLGVEYSIRSMPNTPAMVQEAMTVWTTSCKVTEEQRTLARKLLQSFGKEIHVKDEEQIDMATAVSGTGPAYVFMIMEAMIEAAVHMGMSREMAKEVVVQTIKGSAEYALRSEQHPTLLRNDITSPGGTTAAALYMLEQGNFRTVLSDAIWAAYKRSRELGNKNPQVGPIGKR